MTKQQKAKHRNKWAIYQQRKPRNEILQDPILGLGFLTFQKKISWFKSKEWTGQVCGWYKIIRSNDIENDFEKPKMVFFKKKKPLMNGQPNDYRGSV